MPLDREQARAVLLEALPADPKWGLWVDGIIDRLEPCVTPRLAEIDVRLVGEADAKLARIRALCDEADAFSAKVGYTPHGNVPTQHLYAILDTRP